jgi:hypothetical protein
MAKIDKGIMPEEMRNSISAAQKARYAAISERLDLADRVMRAAVETPDRPVSEIVRMMPLSDKEEE